MEWLVCRDRDGMLFYQTRQQRETSNNTLFDLMCGIPSFVVKVFENEEDAIEFIKEQNDIDNLLDKVL